MKLKQVPLETIDVTTLLIFIFSVEKGRDEAAAGAWNVSQIG
jgi:hypothetical protein